MALFEATFVFVVYDVIAVVVVVVVNVVFVALIVSTDHIIQGVRRELI